MSESSNNQSSTAKAPSHVAYHVRDRKGGDAIWTRIGSAWQHADGKGSTSRLRPCHSTDASACALRPRRRINPSRAGVTARPHFNQQEFIMFHFPQVNPFYRATRNPNFSSVQTPASLPPVYAKLPGAPRGFRPNRK
jgi:hypothetical protein